MVYHMTDVADLIEGMKYWHTIFQGNTLTIGLIIIMKPVNFWLDPYDIKSSPWLSFGGSDVEPRHTKIYL